MLGHPRPSARAVNPAEYPPRTWRIIGGLLLCELEIRLAEAVEGGERLGPAAIPCGQKRLLELVKTAPRDVGNELLAIAKVPVGAAGLTPAQRAASAKVNPAGPFCAISSKAARTNVSLRLPWW
jgi:hypothetical protein